MGRQRGFTMQEGAGQRLSRLLLQQTNAEVLDTRQLNDRSFSLERRSYYHGGKQDDFVICDDHGVMWSYHEEKEAHADWTLLARGSMQLISG